MSPSSYSRRSVQAFALTFLPIFALLFNFLSYNRFSILRPESLVLVCVLLAAATIAMAVAAAWGPAAFIVPAFCLLTYANAVIPFVEMTSSYGAGQAAFLFAAVIVLGILLHRTGARLRSAVILVLLVMIGSQAALSFARPDQMVVKNAAAGKSDAGPVIILILDSQIGANGLPRRAPEYAKSYAAMIQLNERWNFRMFPAAFSHYGHTQESLPSAVEFKELGRATGGKIERNRVFEILKRKGYRLHVFEVDHLKFCNPGPDEPDACYLYLASGLDGLKHFDLPVGLKSLVIAGHWIVTVHPFVLTRIVLQRGLGFAFGPKLMEMPLLGQGALYNRSGSLNSVATFEKLKEDVRKNPKGTAFFAHLLIPHNPFLLDENCTPSSRAEDWSDGLRNPPTNEARRQEVYARYLPQMRCTFKLLSDWFTELEKAGLLDKATIILFGDHGSRIGTYPSAAEVERENTDMMLRDYFSALFAIRSPGIAPGLDPASKPIQTLLPEALESPEKLSIPNPDDFYVKVPSSSSFSEGEPLHKHRFRPDLLTSPDSSKQIAQ